MLTVRQAASVLDMTRENVAARLKRGTISGKKIPSPNAAGFYYLIPESEVERIKKTREEK